MRILAVIFSLFISLVACAQEEQSAATYEAGVHFDVLDQAVKTITPGKIEVTEVFWYGCSHCFSFEPALNRWAEDLPDDVELVKSPAIWSAQMETHARVYYTAKALGVLDKAHSKIFEAMHHQRKTLTSQNEIAEFFKQFGVDQEKFDKTFTSFSITSQAQQSGARARSFKISGTPELIVDGRFRITAKKAGGQAGMLRVADYLIQQIRDKKI